MGRTEQKYCDHIVLEYLAALEKTRSLAADNFKETGKAVKRVKMLYVKQWKISYN